MKKEVKIANPKPCPFCGNVPCGPYDDLAAFARMDGGSVMMECGDCRAIGPEGKSCKDAIDLWNKRGGQLYCSKCDRWEMDQAAIEDGICLRCGEPLVDPDEDAHEARLFRSDRDYREIWR